MHVPEWNWASAEPLAYNHAAVSCVRDIKTTQHRYGLHSICICQLHACNLLSHLQMQLGCCITALLDAQVALSLEGAVDGKWVVVEGGWRRPGR